MGIKGTLGTARPSARLGCAFVYTGSPALRAAVKLGHCSDSTACREKHHMSYLHLLIKHYIDMVV